MFKYSRDATNFKIQGTPKNEKTRHRQQTFLKVCLGGFKIEKKSTKTTKILKWSSF